MKFVKAMLIVMLVMGATQAQNGTILPAQKSAISALATQNGFTQTSLDNYLQINYNSTLTNLSKQNAVMVIQAFQSEDKPSINVSASPAGSQVANSYQVVTPVSNAARPTPQKEPLKASILEPGMSKRFYLIDGNIISGTILSIEGGGVKLKHLMGPYVYPKLTFLRKQPKSPKRMTPAM